MDAMIRLLQEFVLTRYRRFGSRARVEDWQQRQITTHLNWVCQHSLFYKHLSGKPLTDFPIMNKTIMMENLDDINTRGLKKTQLMETALKAEQTRSFKDSVVEGVTVGLSSGTSGQRGLFLADKHEQQIWAGNILAKLLPRLCQTHRIALALRADSPLYSSVAKGPIQFFYADLNKPYQQWIAELDRFQPTLLVGSAQALQFCALHSGQFTSSEMRPERIISGAEVLTKADKAFITDRFFCEVHEVYQCTEGFLGCTDSYGQMRWNQDIVYIEKHWLNADKTHYSPIVTDFRRRTQPIIRYQLDDVIVAQKDTGFFEPIGAIAGRCGDCLTLTQHGVNSVVLPDLIYRAIALASEQRIDYRIIQTAKHTLCIESSPEFHALITNALTALFKQLKLDKVIYDYHRAPNWQISNKQRRVVNQC